MISKHRLDTLTLLMALLLFQGRPAGAGGSPLDVTIGSPGAVAADTHGNVYFSSSPEVGYGYRRAPAARARTATAQ